MIAQFCGSYIGLDKMGRDIRIFGEVKIVLKYSSKYFQSFRKSITGDTPPTKARYCKKA